MRVKSCLLGLTVGLILISHGAAATTNWPSYFKTLDDRQLRREVMVMLTDFAKTYPSDPCTNRAKALVKADANEEDRYAWIGGTLEFADGVLKANPPAKENQKIREAALRILDYPLHVNNREQRARPELKAVFLEVIRKYYRDTIGPASDAIRTTKVDDGLVVWKLYNMGFVVKSKNHTVGFDIFDGGRYASLTTEKQKALLDEVDILFISHFHYDHLSDSVVKTMLESGKKVVLPAPIRKDIVHENLIRLYDNYKEPVDIGGVKVRCFPGHQGATIPCSVYHVTLDGYTVSQNGDNTQKDIYAKMAEVDGVDILLANCWSGFAPYAKATRAKLMITGHENELFHPVSNRESFRKTFGHLSEAEGMPETHVLQWGEQLKYKR